MLKKIFAWALVLAMVLTMMPMMDEHNHAQAHEHVPKLVVYTLYSGCESQAQVKIVCDNDQGCGNLMAVQSINKAIPALSHHGTMSGSSFFPTYKCNVCNNSVSSSKKICTHPATTTLTQLIKETEYGDIYLTGTGCDKCGVFVAGGTYTFSLGVPCAHTTEKYVAIDAATHKVVCAKCDEVITASAAHTPEKDDGDCTTDIKCKECKGIVTPGAAAHTPGEDDGDCTTAIKCTKCDKVATPGAAAHTPGEDDGDCTTDIKCTVCGKVATPGAATHTAGDNTDDCTQPVKCTVCGTVTTEAADAHNLVNGECTNCDYVCTHKSQSKINIKAATCKKAGSYDLKCDACGVITDHVDVVDANAHDWIVFGFGAGYCALCGAISTDDELFEDVLPEPEEPKYCKNNEHEWVEYSFGGWYCYKCEAIATDLNPLDPEKCNHADTYLETVKAATCKKPGVAKEICDICDEVQNENVVLPVDKDNGHSWIVFSFGGAVCELCFEITIDESKFEEPENPQDTCEHDWYQVTHNGYICAKCGKITTDENEVNPPVEEPEEPKKTCPENEHEWVAFSFGGWYCWKCDTYATDISPLEPEICNHADTYIDVTTPATCKTPGVGNKMCDICETMLQIGIEVPVDTENGHKWVQDTYCELCGETKPAKPEDNCDHDWIYFSFGGLICKHCMKIALVNCKADEHYTDNGKCAACGALKGDVIKDGNIDNRDVLKALQMKGGAPTWAADMNDDGTIDNRDVLAILRSK